MNEEQIKKILNQLTDHERRISALEKNQNPIVGNIKTLKKQGMEKSDYSGPKGGTLLLIEEKIFREKQSVEDVKAALEKKGYIYHKDVVRNTLNRLATKTGPLASIKEGKSKVYVERK